MKRLIKSASNPSASLQLGLRGKIYKDDKQVGFYIASLRDGAYSYSVGGFSENFLTPEELIAHLDENGYVWKPNTSTTASKRCVNGNINPQDDDYTERITDTLVRTIDLDLSGVEIEVDKNSIEFLSDEWLSGADQFGFFTSEEDDPEIDNLDNVDDVADKVAELLLDKVFGHVDEYRSFKFIRCYITLVYNVEAEFEANNRGYYTKQGDVEVLDIDWDKANSTVDCQYSRLQEEL